MRTRPGSPVRLIANTFNGSMSITGYDGNQVVIEATAVG